ncbi:hypothetical protein ACFC7A_23925 [Streptomyces niveus]|uniref:hypothetical protein n=1 Tax=Streptomyces niveus TaxID=193462 RepID=UPI0035DF47A5
MDEQEDFDLNTFEGRRGRMEAAIERALDRRDGNHMPALEHANVLDYSRDTELIEARAAEVEDQARYARRVAETDAFGSLVDQAYATGTMDADTTARSEQRYGTLFQRMEEAGYGYAGSINLHEQRREARIANEQLRQADLARNLASAGQRAGIPARDLLPAQAGRRQGESSREDQRSRGTHRNRHHHGGSDKKSGRKH